MDNFERVVYSLRAQVKNISIFFTESNSKMLSDELSSVLSGRYVLFNINPLSYKEYISLTKTNILCEGWITLFVTRTLSLKDQRYSITSIIIKRSVIFNYISVINYYTFIVPKRW